MKHHWLEKDFNKRKKENKNKKKCPICDKYMNYENIGYLIYGFVCNTMGCNNNSNR